MHFKQSMQAHTAHIFSIVIQAAATLTLATTLIATGFAVCCLPQTTHLLANKFSGQDNPSTPFSHADLVQAAATTRAYTLGECDAHELFDTIRTINAHAQTRFMHADSTALLAAPDLYTLNQAALSHLDDVRTVVSHARMPLISVAAGSVLLCIFIGTNSKRKLGTVLRNTGIVAIGLFFALFLGALIDFDGLFTIFHTLFFASGTWTFPQDSLLITMYPLAFWMGMGTVWFATCVLLSLAFLIAGISLTHIFSSKR